MFLATDFSGFQDLGIVVKYSSNTILIWKDDYVPDIILNSCISAFYVEVAYLLIAVVIFYLCYWNQAQVL